MTCHNNDVYFQHGRLPFFQSCCACEAHPYRRHPRSEPVGKRLAMRENDFLVYLSSMRLAIRLLLIDPWRSEGAFPVRALASLFPTLEYYQACNVTVCRATLICFMAIPSPRYGGIVFLVMQRLRRSYLRDRQYDSQLLQTKGDNLSPGIDGTNCAEDSNLVQIATCKLSVFGW